MTTTDFDYLRDRVEDQLTWYDNKSANAKRKCQSLQWLQVIAGALVPVLAGFSVPGGFLGLAGGVAAVAAGLGAIGAYQTLWIRYRAAHEALKREKYLFITSAPPYDVSEKKVNILATRCEEIISSEHVGWQELIKRARMPAKEDETGG